MTADKMARRDFMKGAVVAGAGAGALSTSVQPLAAAAVPDHLEGEVPRKKLGQTDLDIPILFMGCCQTLDPKYDKRLHRCYKLGINYLDTAKMYAEGQSHKTIAPFIKQIKDRKKLIISSKVHLKKEEATPELFKKHLETCLADLQTDYLDIFFMHMLQDAKLLQPEFIKMGEELKKAGKIRYFGFTTHHGTVPEMMQIAAKLGGGIDAIMFRYNFRQYGDLELNKAIDACAKAKIGLLAMKTLGSIPDDAEEVLPWTSKDFTLTQAKLKAVWADERIDGIASQMTNVQQIMENAAAALSPVKLSMSDFVQLNRLSAQTAALHCLGCNQHCEDCVEGDLRVADSLRYLMYHECYGKEEEAKALYQALRPEERDFARYNLEQAMKACPQSIDLQDRLKRAHNLLSA